MASDTVHFRITASTTDPAEMLAIPWSSFHIKALAKRLKVALGKSTHGEVIALLEEALRARSVGERHAIALDTSAKASPRIHARLARALAVRHETKAQRTTPACSKALATALQERAPEEMGPVLEGTWLGDWDGRGRTLSLDIWTLHALLAVIDPRVAPPRTVRLSADVTMLQAGLSPPQAQSSTAVEDFAIRMLGFYDPSGPIGSIGDLSAPIPSGLPFPFVAALTDRGKSFARVHVLTLPSVVAGFPVGLEARTIAW